MTIAFATIRGFGGEVLTPGGPEFTLGSGSGWLERKLGLAADSLRSARVVLVLWTGAGDAPIASLRALSPAVDAVAPLPYAALRPRSGRAAGRARRMGSRRRALGGPRDPAVAAAHPSKTPGGRIGHIGETQCRLPLQSACAASRSASATSPR